MTKIIGIAIIAAAVVAMGALEGGGAMADGTCKDHAPYKVTHGHDSDGDGIGCESNPLPPRNTTAAPAAQPKPSTPTAAPAAQPKPSTPEINAPAKNGDSSIVVEVAVLVVAVAAAWWYWRRRAQRNSR